MRIRKLEVENFMRFAGKHTIVFDKGLSFITGENRDAEREERGDSNGSGKTSIFRAICYALFGRTVEGRKGKNLVTRRIPDGERMSVKLYLSENHTIGRQYNPKGSKVTYSNPIDGEVTNDADQMNALIEERLNITYGLFCSSLYLSRTSTAVQFLYAEPGTRAKLLGGLVNDDVFQESAKLLKLQRGSLDTQYTRLDHERNILKNQVESADKAMAQLQADLEHIKLIDQGRKAKLKEKMDEIRAEMEKLSLVLLKKPQASMQVLEAQRTEARARLSQNQIEVGQQVLISPHNLKPGTRCAHCATELTEEHITHVQALNEQRLKIRKALRFEQEVLNREISTLEDQQQAVRQLDLEQARAQPRMQNLKHEYAHLKTDMEQTSTNSTLTVDRMTRITAENHERKGRITEAEAKMQEIALENTIVSRLIQIFSTEMRNMLFDRIRGVLDSATARHVHDIAGSMMRVEFPNTTRTGQEKFEINLFDGEDKQDLKDWSEGEAWRAAFAVLLALRETMLSRTKCKLSVLLVDDPLGGLDTAGMQNFVRVLRKLNDDKLAETILVAVPKSDFLEGDPVIHVKRERGRSRIIA